MEMRFRSDEMAHSSEKPTYITTEAVSWKHKMLSTLHSVHPVATVAVYDFSLKVMSSERGNN